MQIEFEYFRVLRTDYPTYSTVCNTDIALRVYEGNSQYGPHLLRACGSDLPEPVTSASNVVLVQFNTRYEEPNGISTGFKLSYRGVAPPEEIG